MARAGVKHRPRANKAKRVAMPRQARAAYSEIQKGVAQLDKSIADEVLQMLQPPRPDVRQGDQQQGEAGAAVVAAEGRARRLQAPRQIDASQVAAHQLESAIGRELLGHERDRQIPLDHLPQRAYAQTHQRGLHESRGDMGMSTLLIRGTAPLVHSGHSFLPSVISDWG